MAFFDVTTKILKHFSDAWAGETAFVIDNQTLDTNTVNEFVRVSVRFANSEQAAIGLSRVTRTTGSVIVQVFTKAGTGIKRPQELADKVGAALQYVHLLDEDFNVQFRAANPVDIGQQEGSSFYQINVNVPFYFDAR